jgi:hypothetical protein
MPTSLTQITSVISKKQILSFNKKFTFNKWKRRFIFMILFQKRVLKERFWNVKCFEQQSQNNTLSHTITQHNTIICCFWYLHHDKRWWHVVYCSLFSMYWMCDPHVHKH